MTSLSSSQTIFVESSVVFVPSVTALDYRCPVNASQQDRFAWCRPDTQQRIDRKLGKRPKQTLLEFLKYLN